jgi:hypothetical protein
VFFADEVRLRVSVLLEPMNRDEDASTPGQSIEVGGRKVMNMDKTQPLNITDMHQRKRAQTVIRIPLSNSKAFSPNVFQNSKQTASFALLLKCC